MKKRYAMAVDTVRCVGCNACVISCKTENDLPTGGFRDWIVQEVRGAFPDLSMEIRSERCNHCSQPSCVSACPTGALRDDPDRPALKFVEDACVQCGLCKSTCPEKVITLTPQIDFTAATARTRIIKEEEPALCIRCNKPFGVKSTVDKIAAKLEGRHWMYPASNKRIDAIRMCADCRVITMSEQPFDPFAGVPERAAPRTTEDYLHEREQDTK